MNSIDAILWEAPADFSRFTFVSEQAERLLGYPIERWLSEPTFWADHMHPDDREWCLAYCAEKTAAGEAHDFEYRMIAADGRTVWLRDIVAVVMENGRPVMMRGVMTDITELKQAFEQVNVQEQQYQAIFEATSEGIVINDLETGRVLQANPAFCQMHGHESMTGMQPATYIHPDGYHHFEESLAAIAAGRESRFRAHHVRKDGGMVDVEVIGRAFTYQGKRALLGMVRDVTERVHAERVLERRVQERTRELTSLLDLTRKVASTIEIDSLLSVILEQVRVVADYDRASFAVLNGEVLEVRAVRWVGEETPGFGEGHRVQVDRGPRLWAVIQSGQPAVIDDAQDDSPLAVDYREAVGTAARGVRSWLGIPLMSRDQVMGLLAVSKDVPNFFTGDHARLARAFADQAAVAIQNAELFGSLEKRTKELESLHEVARGVASTLDLDSLVRLIFESLREVVNYSAASLILFQEEALIVYDSLGITTAGHVQSREYRLPKDKSRAAFAESDFPCVRAISSAGFTEAIHAGQTVSIPDVVRKDSPGEDFLRELANLVMTTDYDIRCWMAVPLIAMDRVIGYMGAASEEPNFFTANDERMTRAFADHAAIAVENARLYEQAQKLAASEERQRLARELHDSVSQALYGISLGASTARDVLDADSPLLKPIDYVLSLAEAGLAEMRALIFELRPESIQNEGLVAAISKQIDATQARYGLTVTWEHDEEPEAPLPVKEAVYRITQEALHNVVKHARATNASVSLSNTGNNVGFCVRDDGIGFDPEASFAGHLGLTSMRERAAHLGGHVSIESSETGTTITGFIPY